MNQKKERLTLAWLNETAKGKRRYIALMALLQAVLGGSAALSAVLMRGIVDCAVEKQGQQMWHNATLLILLLLSQAALRWISRLLDESTRAALENRLKSRLFSELLYRDYSAVSAVHSGEWMNRLTSDAAVVANNFTLIIPAAAGNVVRIASAAAVLLSMESGFAWVFLLGGLIILVLTFGLRRKMKELHSRVQSADGDVRIFLTERLGSLMTIRAFGQEASAQNQAEAWMGRHKATRVRRNILASLCNTGLGLTMSGTYTLSAIYCGSRILAGTMSFGTLTAVLQLINQIQVPLNSISGILPQYYGMISSAERLMAVEEFRKDNTAPAVPDMDEFYRQDFRGLELRDVDFSYTQGEEAPEVLKGLNLTIRKGEYVAFTGPSGCGKSTVLKLLMCLYPVDAGQRRILTRDGELPLSEHWRGLFAYVPQGNQLMNGTIREVVTFGDAADMTREAEIRRSLEIACADGFVNDLPEGLDTLLGERGAGLSEGQMQRIAIARAIFSRRPILLLDEATSALDEETERKLLRNLRAMTDQTVIIVTHRTAVLEITDQDIRFQPQK